jgi:hypothetical protein
VDHPSVVHSAQRFADADGIAQHEFGRKGARLKQLRQKLAMSGLSGQYIDSSLGEAVHIVSPAASIRQREILRLFLRSELQYPPMRTTIQRDATARP